MLHSKPLLVIFVLLVDRIPVPAPPEKRGCGRTKVYPDRLIVKALIIMVVRRLYSAYSLLASLEQDTVLTQQLRALLTDDEGRFRWRRTWERRLDALPERLPSLVGALGRHLVCLTQPWTQYGRAEALDSTALPAKSGVWHKKHREQGIVPHTSIDTETHWSKSGHHGWWYGWKLHLACTVSGVWNPLAARLTPANVHDSTPAPALIAERPLEARYVLGDNHYGAPEVREQCERSNRLLVTSGRGPYPHTDPGVDVRRIFHLLRHQAIEPFNGLFKNVFEWGGQVPVKGLKQTQLIVLGAVLLFQLVLLYQFDQDKPLAQGIKPLLRAA
jgi:hypothetical protein